MLKPFDPKKWSRADAAHLLNRAGFGGSPEEIDELHGLGFEGAISRLVDYEQISDEIPPPEWAEPDPDRAEHYRALRSASPEERREMVREERRTQQARLLELRGWWLDRMVRTRRPLEEKLTLFWHGHFATSFVKVRDAYLMWRQNQLFREHAQGEWREFLIAMAQDPAMLIWLDQGQSKKQKPNENFARELMELFTLGEGHYTESDVTEAARALTGWSYNRDRQEFVERRAWHDDGEKTFLGRTGRLKAEDVIDQILKQPQAGRFISGRIWDFFAGTDPAPSVVEGLAEVFHSSGMRIKPVLRAMFSSEAFYSKDVVRNQVKSPAQWLVGAVKCLERDLPPARVSSNMLAMLGQELLAPPNVKGWDGGLAWITANQLLNRYNLAEVLVLANATAMGGRAGRGPAQMARGRNARGLGFEPVDIDKLIRASARGESRGWVAELQDRLIQGKLKPSQMKIIEDYLDQQADIDDEDVRHTIRLIMSTPEFQLA